MTEEGRKYLSDILLAIEKISAFTNGIPNFDAYEADIKTQSAVERQLAIVGEALNKFCKNEPDLTIQNARQIVSFRNRLVHSYDAIDNSIVWLVLKRYLPDFGREIQELFLKP